jgi:XTP/dITP diphosphohydrolase
MSLRIALATRNPGKIREIRDILAGLDVELVDPSCFPPFAEPAEDGDTFLDNALAKAKAVRRATGLPALADDSGLEVDALGGAPGVRSARYGGPGLTDEGRCARLLGELAGVRDEDRGARFRCAAVLYPAPGAARKGLAAEGFLYGRIVRSPRGGNGFGYDPVFLVPERGMTLAEMDPGEKNATSHRYRALIELKHMLVRDCGVAAKR